LGIYGLEVSMKVAAWSGVTLEAPVTGGHRNEVWSGCGPGGRVAIRRSRRSAVSLAWELDLLAELSQAGFLVPTPVLTDTGGACDGGVVVQRWIDGYEPESDDDWSLVADELHRLHGHFVGHDQRPGCHSVVELDRFASSVDADMSQLPDDVAADVLAVFATFATTTVSVVHGDPGPSNLRITTDGRVGFLDWDESRVDAVELDLVNLGIVVLPDAEHRRARLLADAWEAANAWIAEPDYARIRLRSLRQMQNDH
jgi:Ser/Thr protein kinase RdoA (MazF antagonist)